METFVMSALWIKELCLYKKQEPQDQQLLPESLIILQLY